MRFLAYLLSMIQVLSAVISPASYREEKTFTDVTAGSWYYEDVAEMAAEGILNGYPNGSFKPGNTITGAEFVSIVGRVGGLTEGCGQSSHWAAGMMQAVLERGWYDWDEFPPTAENYNLPITRQVAVKVLMKALFPDARGDYSTESAKISDFSQLDGRYYEQVLAAYSLGIARGDKRGTFRPKDGLNRAEACALIRRAMKTGGAAAPGPSQGGDKIPEEEDKEDMTPCKGGVSENGKLQVIGTQLCNEKGEPVVLHGMSSHGLQWFGDYASAGAIRTTADYGANVFRLAMYTAEGGYLSQQSAMEKKVTDGVAAAKKNDMYVIIDWHILSDGDPMANISKAKDFFSRMAKKYKDDPAVIFEICNEPNGGISWAGNVKPYAEEIVKAIRGEGNENVILIGSPTWSQDVDAAAKDPVSGKNLMYTLHFYAGTHTQWLRDRASAATKAGLPIFVSEWGVSDASGSGGVYLEEAGRWLDYMDRNKISWCCWSLCDKSESSAVLNPGASKNGGWKDSDLSPAGKFVFSKF